MLPSYVGRCDLATQRRQLRHVLEQLADLRRQGPVTPLSLWIAMQWAPGEEPESLHRLAKLVWLAAAQPGLAAVGLSLPGPGKLHSSNAAIKLAEPLGLAGWCWVDDDVSMEPGCLAQLAGRFRLRGQHGAVGAAKIAQARPYQGSKLLCRIGQLTAPPRACPHACCMIVAAGVVAGGIPTWLGSDDGYVLFELLDPARADPWEDLVVVPEARCRYLQGSHVGETLRRLHRALYSHLLHVSTYPWPVGRAYLSGTLFYGLWPLAPWDRRYGFRRAAIRWLAKAIHFGWAAGVAAVLVGRGLVNRPRRPPPITPYAEYRSALPAAAGTDRTGGA